MRSDGETPYLVRAGCAASQGVTAAAFAAAPPMNAWRLAAPFSPLPNEYPLAPAPNNCSRCERSCSVYMHNSATPCRQGTLPRSNRVLHTLMLYRSRLQSVPALLAATCPPQLPLPPLLRLIQQVRRRRPRCRRARRRRRQRPGVALTGPRGPPPGDSPGACRMTCERGRERSGLRRVCLAMLGGAAHARTVRGRVTPQVPVECECHQGDQLAASRRAAAGNVTTISHEIRTVPLPGGLQAGLRAAVRGWRHSAAACGART